MNDTYTKVPSAYALSQQIRKEVPDGDFIRVDIDANSEKPFSLWVSKVGMLMAIDNQTVKGQPRPFALCMDNKGFFISSKYFEYYGDTEDSEPTPPRKASIFR